MQNERPIGVTLFVVWSFLAGIFVLLAGLGLMADGVSGIGAAATDELSRSWLPYYWWYAIVGIVWVLGTLVSWVAAFFLFNADDWGRKAGIYSIIPIAVGWGIIKIISLSWGNPPPLIGLLVVIPMLYLLTEQVRDYCGAD